MSDVPLHTDGPRRRDHKVRALEWTTSAAAIQEGEAMRATTLLVGGLVALLTVTQAGAIGPRTISVLDNCDPDDPAWNAIGGCNQRRGDVTLAEFNALLSSPLSAAVVGHPSWRNEPSYLTVEFGRTVRVENEGGREHTFTEVADFGGGFVAPLRLGLTPAPECLDAPTILAPGDRVELNGLDPGLHRFQCCIHPWMRAAIRVEED